MRILASILGGLFMLVALLVGLLAAAVLADAGSDGSVTCNTVPGQTSSTTYCNGDGSGDSQYQAVGVAMAVGAAGLFVGGCALIGGAVAAGRKPAAVGHPPQSAPVTSSGPPSYGGGGGAWQGSTPAGGS